LKIIFNKYIEINEKMNNLDREQKVLELELNRTNTRMEEKE
jgi:hypothetical protein